MTKINNIKAIFKKLKFNKTNNLKSISSNPNHQLINNSELVQVRYSYLYNTTHDLLDSFNFQTKKHNIDSVHRNMKNKKYGLEVQIPFHKDFETNKLKHIIKHINHINISIYYKGKKKIEDLIFINNKSPTITVNYNDLLNKYIAKINNGKTFCYFNSTKKDEKCGNISFPYIYSKNTSKKIALIIYYQVFITECKNSVKIKPCIYKFKNERLEKTCYDPNRLFYNVEYYTDKFYLGNKTVNSNNVWHILTLNEKKL